MTTTALTSLSRLARLLAVGAVFAGQFFHVFWFSAPAERQHKLHVQPSACFGNNSEYVLLPVLQRAH